jgi:hypothetical protein
MENNKNNTTVPALKSGSGFGSGLEASSRNQIFAKNLVLRRNQLHYTQQKLSGKNYHFYTTVISPSMKHAVTKHLFEEGYILPKCVIVKIFARVEGVEGSFIISIAYLEDISDTEYPCSAWMDKDKLTEAQKQYIKNFSEKFMRLFEVLEYTKPDKKS